jgi:hypothetical protein
MGRMRNLYLSFTLMAMVSLAWTETTPRVAIPIQHEHEGSPDLAVPRTNRQITVEAIQDEVPLFDTLGSCD